MEEVLLGLQKQESKALTCFWPAWTQLRCFVCKHTKSGGTLDKKGILGIPELQRVWTPPPTPSIAPPQGLTKSCDSQGERKSIVKVIKTTAAFLYANWRRYQFVAWDYKQDPTKLQFEVLPVGGCTALDHFPVGTPDCCQWWKSGWRSV